jgi:hypothetical protein
MKSCHLRQDPSSTYYYAVYDHSLESASAVQHMLPTPWGCSYADDGGSMVLHPPQGGGDVPLNVDLRSCRSGWTGRVTR